MPNVPIYSTSTVAPTGLPDFRQRAPEFKDPNGMQLRTVGEGMANLGGDLTKVMIAEQEEANKLRVQDAMNTLIRQRTDLRAQASQLRGRDALERPDGMSLPDEFGKKFDEISEKLATSLGNDAQRRVFAQQAGQAGLVLRDSLSSYMLEQQRVFRDDTDKATIRTAVGQAVALWNDPTVRDESINAIRTAVESQAAANGWDSKTREAALVDAMSPMHAGIMKTMIANNAPGAAREYYERNSAQMTVQDRMNLQGVLKSANEAMTANTAADEVWAAIGPKGANDPVRIFDMEQTLRAKLKDNPDALRIGIDGLRQRASAFNAQQSEMKASNVAGVWKLLDSGVSFAQLASGKYDAWNSLSDTERHEIKKAAEAEASTRATRAAADSARALTDLQRQERMAFMRNGDKFLTISDPHVLRQMTRAQVEAQRTEFGMEPTMQLLAKWDAIQDPRKFAEARMDQEDFNQVADKLGLSPFDPTKSEPQKRALGTLKSRVEQAIDIKQQEAKRPLTREEKMQTMREEMARTVTVNPGWWRPDQTVPVVQLGDKDIENVRVPAVDRARILSAMQARFASTKDPLFAPTDANVRYWYLNEKSPVAGRMLGGK